MFLLGIYIYTKNSRIYYFINLSNCVIFYIDPIQNWWSLLIFLRLLIYRILTHRVSTVMGSENFIDKAFFIFFINKWSKSIIKLKNSKF